LELTFFLTNALIHTGFTLKKSSAVETNSGKGSVAAKKKRKTTVAPKKSNGKKKDLLNSTAKSGSYV
jgi:hypothetical protein